MFATASRHTKAEREIRGRRLIDIRLSPATQTAIEVLAERAKLLAGIIVLKAVWWKQCRLAALFFVSAFIRSAVSSFHPQCFFRIRGHGSPSGLDYNPAVIN
jgi:hypothetical protein